MGLGMSYVLNFIKAYLDRKCPQGQSRVIASADKKCLLVSLLKPGGSGAQVEHTYSLEENPPISEFCNRLIIGAGYSLEELEFNLAEFARTKGEGYIVERSN